MCISELRRGELSFVANEMKATHVGMYKKNEDEKNFC